MYKLNKDGTRAIMTINGFANICGYFFNANFDDSCSTCPNNGYNCKHPDCEEEYKGIGCCHTWSCPFGFEADEEDCKEFGYDYEEGEFIVVFDAGMLEKLAEGGD